MDENRQIKIDPLSMCSIFLNLLKNGNPLWSATGYISNIEGKSYLITNKHVVSGTNPFTEANKGIPDSLLMIHHSSEKIGKWVKKIIPLYNEDGSKAWLEYSRRTDIDVVLLPINESEDIKFYPIDLSLADTDLVVTPAMTVSIIGFPFGHTGGAMFPIWKTGHIASEPEIDYYPNRPAFLIDATTRGGMSGAPVVVRMSGGYKTSNGNFVMSSGQRTKFLGTYSGRLLPDEGSDDAQRSSEIGIVWRPRVLYEIAKNSN